MTATFTPPETTELTREQLDAESERLATGGFDSWLDDLNLQKDRGEGRYAVPEEYDAESVEEDLRLAAERAELEHGVCFWCPRRR